MEVREGDKFRCGFDGLGYIIRREKEGYFQM